MVSKGKVYFMMLMVIFFLPVVGFALEVDWISGNVSYSHLKGEWKELEIGMRLIPGDIVKTGPVSEATLLENGVELYILENSTFSVAEKYVEEEKKSSFMLFLGRMRFKLGQARKGEPEISTQSVTLAIRGTEFEVGTGYDGSTLVLIQEGSVAVSGKKKELLLAQGEGTEVAFGEEPEEKFEVMTRVIDWDQWFVYSKEAVKGNELKLLDRVFIRFTEIQEKIKEYEQIREKSLEEKESFLEERDRLLKEGKEDEASEFSRKAGTKSKIAFHSIVNIRFLALSSIGLYDMAQRIYQGVEEPSPELSDLYENITEIFEAIEKAYIREGDREMLEKKAERKKGCIKIF